MDGRVSGLPSPALGTLDDKKLHRVGAVKAQLRVYREVQGASHTRFHSQQSSLCPRHTRDRGVSVGARLPAQTHPPKPKLEPPRKRRAPRSPWRGDGEG